MKTFLAFLCLCSLLLPVSAQQVDPCGTDNADAELLQQHPEQLQHIERLEQFTEAYEKAYYAQQPGQRRGMLYIIPVVFHVVHNYGDENISDEQIYDAVRILNEDFRKMNADISTVVPQFQNLTADCEIEFRLATIDPDRNPTNGIDRIRSVQTLQGTNDSKLNQWPRDMYLNIWVTRQVQQSGGSGVTLAYAYLPGSVEGQFGTYDGIVVLSNSVGSIGNAILSRSRTLTHEIGHFLNLKHPWGNAPEPGVTCGDDDVSDTPETKGSFSCNLNRAQCHPPVIENTQNYMDYSGCPRMFTEGQKVRMLAALNSDVSHRDNLWQQATLDFTGVEHASVAPPVADFNAAVRMACVDERISFKDFSWRGPITAWEWSFSNATPATSTDQNPTVTFNQPGWQTVSLKVTSPLGAHQKVMDKYVYVTKINTVSKALREDFENIPQFADEWVVNNIDNNATQWQITGSASYSGGASLMLNNFQGRFDIDEVVTPAYNLANNPAAELKFQYSFASKSTNGTQDVNDTLTVYYSLNCGANWVQLYRESGTALVTAGNFTYNFLPDRESLWKEVAVALPSAVSGNSNVRFKFVFNNSGSANNLFLDNINVSEKYTSAGSSVTNPSASLNVYPVPASGIFNIEMYVKEATSVLIELFDVMGKTVAAQNQTLSAGSNIIPMQADLPTGIYTLSVSNDGERMVRKVSVVR